MLAGLWPSCAPWAGPSAWASRASPSSGPWTGEGDPADRLPGSLAAAAAAVLGGAHVIRAHDVAETVQAVRVAQAIACRRGGRAAGTSS